MAQVTQDVPRLSDEPAAGWTAADLVERFGPMPLWRIVFNPPPGEATEEDVIRLHDRTNRLFELVDGVMVEKTEGTRESLIAGLLIHFLNQFVLPRKLGVVLAPDGMLRLSPGLIRIPDVSFISRAKLPGGKAPSAAVADLVPDLAVEVLSRSNTKREMERKLAEYFDVGVKLVWFVDLAVRTVTVFRTANDSRVLAETDTLDGGDVLPGFAVEVRSLFEE